MNPTRNTDLTDLVPSEFYLSQNYPNPFREKTTIKFCLPYRTKVRLQVFNSEGGMVRTLLDEEKEAGSYELEFSAEDRETDGLPDGARELIASVAQPGATAVYSEGVSELWSDNFVEGRTR